MQFYFSFKKNRDSNVVILFKNIFFHYSFLKVCIFNNWVFYYKEIKFLRPKNVNNQRDNFYNYYKSKIYANAFIFIINEIINYIIYNIIKSSK